MSSPSETRVQEMYDAIIVGAGISGMYQLYRLRELGLEVKVLEAGDGVGGTWYWNRYPGARFDSESYSYGYSFSEELLQEWDWSEHFSPQPETLKYCNYVADKFDLKKDIQFSARVKRARFDDEGNAWTIEIEDGSTETCRLLITAVGPLSAPTLPDIPGMDTFEGPVHHTGLWPKEPVDFSGLRVGVIGTGATAVQLIPEVAKVAEHLTVFQRTPNWCAPLNNGPITEEEQKQIKAGYPDIFRRCAESHGGFLHSADPRKALEVSAEERDELYEHLYGEPGFGIWLGTFIDVLVDPEANDTMSEFAAKKIRERVKDPATAEKLIPKNHGFGTRRVPMETGYYETYNRDNVDLVDIIETPIEKITENSIVTSDNEYELDFIVLATGFDAVRGALDRIDIQGKTHQKLTEYWGDQPTTYLGMAIHGFPNLLTLVGPHNSATFCNIPRCIEQNVEWVTDLVKYMIDHDYGRVEATADAEAEWTQHVFDEAEGLLFTKTRSWFMGFNSNIEGRDKPTMLVYAGGAPKYRDKCQQVADENYKGFSFQ